MKTILLVATTLTLSSFPAKAGEIDFDKFTCAQFSAQAEDIQMSMWYWMDGQVHGVVGDTTFEPDDNLQLITGLADACKDRPNEQALAVYDDISK